MATVASFLDDVAAFAIGCPDPLRDSKKFPVAPHPVPGYGVTAFVKIGQLFGMTLPAFFREDHGFLLRGCLVVDVTGHAVDALLGMLRFHPGLEQTRRYSLVTFHAKSRVHLRVNGFLEEVCARKPAQG